MRRNRLRVVAAAVIATSFGGILNTSNAVAQVTQQPPAAPPVATRPAAMMMAPAEASAETSQITFADVLAKAIPAVVTVRVTSEVQVPLEFKPGVPLPDGSKIQTRLSRSGGSGVIVDPANGHILTNNHVIDGAVRIEVVLADGRLLAAKLIGRDIGTDLAVIEVAARDLKSLAIGNSDKVRIGDVVLAIGNPFGLEGTATLGIVSATMRSEIGHEAFEDFFQIDAVINPGNSGGALVNTRGELVAINTATAGRAGNVGIGFAIPINMAKTIKAELIRNGRMRRGSIGLMVEDLSVERAAELMSGTNRGAFVTAVVPGSPAAAAGIEIGSIVTSVAGKPVRSATELKTRIVTVPLGTKLEFVIRKSGVDRLVQLETVAIAEPTVEHTVPDGLGGLDGLVAADIAPGNRHFGDLRGSEVVRVAAGSRAERLGLQPGDVITGIDEHDVRHTEHLFRFADRAGMSYRLLLRRQTIDGWIRVVR